MDSCQGDSWFHRFSLLTTICWLVGWLVGWLVVCLLDLLIFGWLASFQRVPPVSCTYYIILWLVGWLVDWLVVCLLDLLFFGWLASFQRLPPVSCTYYIILWLVGWLANWLVGWLGGWGGLVLTITICFLYLLWHVCVFVDNRDFCSTQADELQLVFEWRQRDTVLQRGDPTQQIPLPGCPQWVSVSPLFVVKYNDHTLWTHQREHYEQGVVINRYYANDGYQSGGTGGNHPKDRWM